MDHHCQFLSRFCSLKMALSNVFKRVGRKFISDRRYYECLAATFSNRYYIAAGCCKTKTLNFAIKAVHNRFGNCALAIKALRSPTLWSIIKNK